MNEVSCHMVVTFLVIILLSVLSLTNICCGNHCMNGYHKEIFFFKASILCLNIPTSSSGIPGIYAANYFQNNVTSAK